MNTKNQIGLDSGKAQELASNLNVLLSNFQIFYINTRGLHWNIKGNKFFELHLKFEELYTNALLKIDEIAERILTLGHLPLHSYSGYLEVTTIKEAINVSEDKEAIELVIKSFTLLLELERDLLELSSLAKDAGTNALMSDYIREQEKMLWMFNAYLNVK